MAGLDAFGTQLQRGDGATPEVFTPIANVTDITPPGIERETYDVTAHDSEDAWRSSSAAEGRWRGRARPQLRPPRTRFAARRLRRRGARSYKVVWPGTLGNWAFKAIITNFEPEAPHDDKLAASVTYKVSGKPTITTGA
ncbi:phage tail tube protein [Streptomyces scabiei]|uniref:phage tail tube protein n=1 Tax=Streptomyces scabiei TaxID=1930 RepID=UPI002FEFE9BA